MHLNQLDKADISSFWVIAAYVVMFWNSDDFLVTKMTLVNARIGTIGAVYCVLICNFGDKNSQHCVLRLQNKHSHKSQDWRSLQVYCPNPFLLS